MYLDANATTQPLPEVVDAVVEAMTARFGNPSSPHYRGDVARGVLGDAREAVGAFFGVDPDNVIFTSGGTEGVNIALEGVRANGCRTLITSAVEHAAVLTKAHALEVSGVGVRRLSVDPNGLVKLDDLEQTLREADGRALVSIQIANGETGVVQPWQAIARLLHAFPSSFFHADAAQAVGRLPIEMSGVAPDAITFSSHKVHGPIGVGCLVLREDTDFKPGAVVLGGGQERGLRAGTEPVALAAGLGKALSLRQEGFVRDIAKLLQLRDAFEAAVVAPAEAFVNGGQSERSPNTSNLRFPGVDATALLALLDQRGVLCSQGAACASGKPEPSHVLTAMGLPEAQAYECLRFSFSVLNDPEEVAEAAGIVVAAARELRGRKVW